MLEIDNKFGHDINNDVGILTYCLILLNEL